MIKLNALIDKLPGGLAFKHVRHDQSSHAPKGRRGGSGGGGSKLASVKKASRADKISQNNGSSKVNYRLGRDKLTIGSATKLPNGTEAVVATSRGGNKAVMKVNVLRGSKVVQKLTFSPKSAAKNVSIDVKHVKNFDVMGKPIYNDDSFNDWAGLQPN